MAKNFLETYRIVYSAIANPCMMALSFFMFFMAGAANADRGLTADSLMRRVLYQTWSFPQEKVYISTDRDAFVTGDTIRFRAFLVDASTHKKQENQSKFIYVELNDPFGKNVSRVKVIENDGGFAGIIPLDEEMPEGTYTLCAYTQFMENSGKEYFFRKSIPVFSQLSSKYRLETRVEDGRLIANLYEKGSDRPVTVDHISIIGPDGEYFASRIMNRSNYSMSVSKRMTDAKHVVVKFDKYEKFVAIPGDTTSFSVTFHPEGGHLIPEESNLLAFKAIDRNGLYKEISGMIVDDAGNKVADMQSEHKGMGAVSLTPEPGKTYTAIIEGREYAIPKAEGNATVLSIADAGNDRITIKTLGPVRDNLSLMALNGGAVAMAIDMQGEKEITLDRGNLGSGIVRFLLGDDAGDILSSRMIFNHSGYLYGVPLDSLPAGDYTVRASISEMEGSKSTIVSNLLLQSELKGHIEDPDFYFSNRDNQTDSYLDLLMLTQGWERYDVESALHGKYAEPEIPLEIGGDISGIVKSRWRGKPLGNASVMLISPQLDYADQSLTDADGRFEFNGMDWPDDTAFIIQVMGESGNKEHNFIVDKDEFPKTDPIETRDDSLLPEDLIDFDLLTSGTIMLEELVVTAPLSAEDSRREMLRALGVRSFNSEEMEENHITSYEEVFRKIPGIRVINGNVVSSSVRASMYNTGVGGAPVEYWVDGVMWTPSSTSFGSMARSNAPELVNAPLASENTYGVSMNNTLTEFEGSYPFHTVETIEYYRPSTAMVISMSAAQGGGALVITTKDGGKIKDWDSDLFMRTIRPLGYQNEPEAYEPHYTYDLTSDDGKYKAAWFPKVSAADSIPDSDDHFIELEGLANGYIPVYLLAKPQHMAE